MIDKYWLYMLFNTDSNVAFLDFVVALYEIPKRQVDLNLSASQKKKVREKYIDYFAKHGLKAEQLQAVRDDYVHRIVYIGDLRKSLKKLRVTSVMSYVNYFELDITLAEVSRKKYRTVKFLNGLCDTFGNITLDSAREGRFSPFKED